MDTKKDEPIRPSEEVLRESYERVFEKIDSLIATNPAFKDKNCFLDVSLVNSINYVGQQHVNLRERDEDVYEISTPNEYSRRIFLFKPTKGERMADQISDALSQSLESTKPTHVTSHFISPDSKTDKIDQPQIGDVIVNIYERYRGWPISAFLIHQEGNISEQCESGLSLIKNSN